MKKIKFFVYTPFTGLGLYNGFRGNRWLKNRISIFKQFVIPSLLNQSDRNFIHWISWRPEERSNSQVKELAEYLKSLPGYQFIFTFNGICFWDDKYPEEEAHARLSRSLHFSTLPLVDLIGEAEYVTMMIQPSDDLYEKHAVRDFKRVLDPGNPYQAAGYKSGYLCNYHTKEIRQYNPKTTPPFFAYTMPRETFLDPRKHMEYTGPYKSHEYIGDKMLFTPLPGRGFLVGTHGENISTHFNHPFGTDGEGKPLRVDSTIEIETVLDRFGILHTTPIALPFSLRKWILRHLPHGWQKKLRYLWGEKVYGWFYQFIRN